MTAIRNILVASDLSTPARHAARRAASLAQEHGARLTLQHVVDEGALATLDSLLESAHSGKIQTLNELAQRGVNDLAGSLKRQYDIEPVVRLDSGRVIKAMMQALNDIDPELVVLGARGQGFVRHMLLGSTPERLLTRTRKPILVVRQAPREAYQRILVAVDFSARSLASLRVARALSPHASLLALHVHQIPYEGRLHAAGLTEAAITELRDRVRAKAEADMATLVEQARNEGIEVTPQLESGDPAYRLLQHEHEHDCDLIVVGKHTHDPIADATIGSVARHVISHAEGDILVVDQAA